MQSRPPRLPSAPLSSHTASSQFHPLNIWLANALCLISFSRRAPISPPPPPLPPIRPRFQPLPRPRVSPRRLTCIALMSAFCLSQLLQSLLQRFVHASRHASISRVLALSRRRLSDTLRPWRRAQHRCSGGALGQHGEAALEPFFCILMFLRQLLILGADVLERGGGRA